MADTTRNELSLDVTWDDLSKLKNRRLRTRLKSLSIVFALAFVSGFAIEHYFSQNDIANQRPIEPELAPLREPKKVGAPTIQKSKSSICEDFARWSEASVLRVGERTQIRCLKSN